MNSFYKSPGAVKLEHLKIYLDELLHRNYGGITRGAVGANIKTALVVVIIMVIILALENVNYNWKK